MTMESTTGRAPLAVTCGDPAGIGPEVIARWVAEPGTAVDDLFFFGPAAWLEALRRVASGPVAGMALGGPGFVWTPGQPSPAGARLAWEALESAAGGCRAGAFSGVVTGPTSKAELAAVGWAYPGQTEYFAARWGGKPTMGFVGRELRIVLATWHLPLADVPEALTQEVLARAVEGAAALARRLAVTEPRIGVCGLNPHAGEGGLLGRDEIERLDPWLDALRPAYPGLSRCLPGDTVFFRQRRGEFDVVVALYHDQALGPLKTLEFDDAVNVTLGLPWVRTSPDHGTAFGLVGKGVAKADSFAAAVTLARTWVRQTTDATGESAP